MPQRKFRLSTTLLWAWALALVLAFAGCAPEFEMESCTSEEDCFPDEVCSAEGVCVLDEGSDKDVGEDDTEDDIEDDVEEEDPVVATIEISPASGTVAVGLSIPFQAKGYDEDGELVEDAIFLWSTKSSSVASVNNAGVVTGQAEGETEVVASWADDTTVSGSASVTVVFGDIDRVEVLPEEATANVGDTVLYEATVYTEGDVEVTDAQIIWSVEDETVAEVDETGQVTALGVGETEVIANVEGIEGRALFIVENTPPVAKAGDDQTVRIDELVTVSATDSVDLEDDFEDLSFAWEFVEDPSNGADELEDADSATATFRPSVVGEYVLQVTVTDSHGGEDTATVTITVEAAPAIDVIKVEPTSATLVYGEVLELEVTVEDGEGNVLDDAEVVFTTDDDLQHVLHVTGAGKVITLGAGEAKIFVDAPGTTAPTVEISITVEWGTVEKLTLDQTTADLEIDDTLQLVATAENEFDQDITDYVTLTWATEDDAVATVDNDGLVSAVGEGQTTITVSVDGETASATITVGGEDDEPVVTDIVVTPDVLTDVLVGATGQFTVVDQDSNQISTDKLTFFSSDEDAFYVDVTGDWLVMDIGAGAVTVTVTYEDGEVELTETVNITIVWGEVDRVEVSPSEGIINVGDTVQFTVKAFNTEDEEIPASELTINWISSDDTVATVDGNGLATGHSDGSAEITAVVNGKTSPAAELVVVEESTQPVPAKIDVIESLTPIIGVQGTLDAKVLDAENSEISGAGVTFTSDDTDIIDIDNDGSFIAKGIGTTKITVASTDDPTVFEEVDVEITRGAIASIEITPTTATINAGETETLTVKVMNAAQYDITDYVTVVWSSADGDIASVDANTGVVTGVAAGTVTITVTVDGAVSEDVSVTVEAEQQAAEFHETFDNVPASPNGYSTGTFPGNHGIEWEYNRLRTDDGGQYAIDGMSVILANKGADIGYVRAQNIPGGIASLSVDYRKAFTGQGDRQIEVLVNDQVVAVAEPFGGASGADSNVYTLAVSNLDIEGEFKLEIRDTKGNQVTIDNIRWTPYNP